MERRLCTLIYLCNIFCIFIKIVILIKHTKSEKYIYKETRAKINMPNVLNIYYAII